MNGKTISFLVVFVVIVISILSLSFYLHLHSDTKAITFQKTQVYKVKEQHNSPLNISATTLPKFVVPLTSQKFSNVWRAYAQNISAEVVNVKKENLKIDTTFDSNSKQLFVTPHAGNDFKPGLYTLTIAVKTYNGKDITITQDFRWGVLAINTGKAVYKPGETVKIGMGVLDDRGNTKCIAHEAISYDTAKVWLTIISPSGKIQQLSTDAGSIKGSQECAPTSVTNNPDFQAETIAQEVGKYTIHMTAENINGKRSIDDYFTVSQEKQSFIIMRTSYPTRIYPFGHYPVEITIIANRDYTGSVSDFVPANFQISNISDGGQEQKYDAYQRIQWQVNWSKGQTYVLMYDIKFPLVSPEFYLVGPLTIGSFTEGREWQIASDAISLVESNFAVNNASASTASVTLPSALTANNLEIIVCAMPANVAINVPSTNGGATWTSAFSVNNGSNPRIRAWYRLARATESTTFTCNFNGGAATTNPKAIQIFEYSGLATSTIKDVSSTRSNISCTSGTFSTATITTGNPIELVFASEVANGNPARNVLSHSAGFTTETAFSGTFGTFTTADQNISSIGTYSDTVTFSGGAGTCSGGIVSFNTPISVSQNGFRFFQNATSTTPGTPIDLQNTNITLATPHQSFRLRFLLDVDGTQTVGLQSADFILNYATLSAQFSGCNDPTLSYDPVSTPGTGTDIAFNSNGLGSGISIASSGNDPTDSGYTSIFESYYEDDGNGPNGPAPGDITNDQNAIAGNQAGLWDVSLIDNTSDFLANTYCLKLSNGSGTDLSAYVRYPQVTTFYNEVNIKSGTVIKSGTIIN